MRTPLAPSGWPDRDGAAPGVVAVHALALPPRRPTGAREELPRPHQGDAERLVALHGVEVVDFHARPLEQLLGGRHRRRQRATGSSAATTKCRNAARTVRPSDSATERSAMSMAAAPSEVCEAFPAVMSGATSDPSWRRWAGRPGSRGCSRGGCPRPARASRPSRCLRRLAGDGHGLASEVAVLPVLVRPPVALHREGVHVLAGDLVALGEDL